MSQHFWPTLKALHAGCTKERWGKRVLAGECSSLCRRGRQQGREAAASVHGPQLNLLPLTAGTASYAAGPRSHAQQALEGQAQEL